MSDEIKHIDFSLTKWTVLNMVGWIVGTFTVVILNFFYTRFDFEINNFSPFLDFIITIALWLPIGFTIGFIQSYFLSQGNIKKSVWVYATTFGWWIPAVILYLYSESGFYQPNSFSPIIETLIIGACLGASQAYLLRIDFWRTGVWITTNALGVCALVFLHSHVLFPSYSYHSTIYERIVHNLFAQTNQPLYYFLSTFTEEIGIAFIPFIGALTIALPTGLLLVKFIGSKSSEKNSSIASTAG